MAETKRDPTVPTTLDEALRYTLQAQGQRNILYAAVEEAIRTCPTCHGEGHTWSRYGPGADDFDKDECTCTPLQMALAKVNGEITEIALA